ncbi:MAG TPA: TonB-dependent receptor [Rhizomicrobium sp.]|nr:TonB-dependent receptor [Rhizomicrobium sp.]
MTDTTETKSATSLHKRLCVRLLAATALQLISIGAAVAQDNSVEEVIITANRREEVLSKVPISVAAYTDEAMEQRGVKSLSDLQRLTPGLNLSNSQQNSGNTISIRGIASSAGSSTTGIYIDDVPIQAAALGTAGYGQTYPVVFDLARIEVLRGPQGTLFGSGSEGGTIRFIQPEPSLTDYDIYARAEGNKVGQDGATGYEYGLAGGGPIIEGKLGFRLSGYYRKQAGWINEEQGTVNVLNATGAAGPNSIQFQPGGLVDKDANWQTATSLRAALSWAPTDSITITPSVQYQDQYLHYQGGTFYVQPSNPRSDTYVNLMAVPTVDATHVAIPDPLNEPADDQFIMPNLKAVWNINDNWSLTSNSAMLVRKQWGWTEYPSYETTYGRRCCVLAGDKADGVRMSNYNNYTQELRLQFDDPDSWISGTAGYFFSRFRQEANQDSISNYFHNLAATGTPTSVNGTTYPGGVTNGAPFGAGYSAWINYFGLDLPTFNKATSPFTVQGAAAGNYPYTISYQSHLITHQDQNALFGQVEIKLPYALTATLGARLAQIDSDFYSVYGGATSNLYQPHGLPCVPGTGGPGQPACQAVAVGQYAPGTGPFQIAFPSGTATSSEQSFTPKLGLSWQMNDDNMFYGTASKGFRPGGSQARLNSGCDYQLIQLGYTTTNSSGGVVADPPTQYKSDSVWSYEVGAKNRLFDGMLDLDTSGYLVTWRSIQTSVSVSTCNQSITDNLGGAEAKGFDLQATLRPLEGLTLVSTVGYNETSFTGNVVLGGSKVYSAGSAVPNSGPPLRATLFGRYDFKLKDLPLYVLGNVAYSSKTRRSGQTDLAAYNYDGQLRLDQAYTQTDLRVGVVYGNVDASIFINNLTDEAPLLTYSHTSITSPVYTASTIQPRTVGVTLTYRQ